MRILLTNDDGIHAPGILALKQTLETLGEVFTVAPERQRSASGHGMTMHKPLRINPVKLADGSQGYSVSGTPTDCVVLGVDIVMEGRCDLVVSGINSDANLGDDITYSGTVAAAFEATILRLPAIALSLAREKHHTGTRDYAPAAKFAVKVVQQLFEHPLPPQTFVNVNVPCVPESEIRGVRITHQGKREYVDRTETRYDPSGRPYYWQFGSLRDFEHDPESDVQAVLEDYISVTPIHLDLTSYSALDHLRAWRL